MSNINVLVLEEYNIKKIKPQPGPSNASRLAKVATLGGITGGTLYGGSKIVSGLSKGMSALSKAHAAKLRLASGG